ncbi:MAG: ABC transporter permease [Anaerolineae bacterium]|nr:ABC transporter permease [Anaerolineae bacterium]
MDAKQVASGRGVRPRRGLLSLRAGWAKPFLLLLPTTSILVVFFVVPALVFLLYSFWGGQAFRIERVFTLRSYAYALTSAVYRRVAISTLWTGFLSAALTTLLAYPLAYFLTFRVRRGRNAVLFLVVISLLSGYLVRVYAWRTILGRNGLINSFLLYVGLVEEPLLFLVFSRLAVVITLVHVFLPFTILPILSSLANVRTELVEAAKDLGAGPLQAFLRVTLPMSMTGVISGFTYTLVLSAGDYITPELVGGTTGIMIGRSIADQFIRTGNWPLGSALSFLVLSLFMVIYFGVRWAAKYLKLAPAD